MEIINHSKNLILPSLFLASASPRRRQLLESLGLSFQILAHHGEEITPQVSQVETISASNALNKATSICSELSDPRSIAIGADTLVVTDQDVLGKPKNRAEVVQSLTRLSGKAHRVITGLALVSPKFGKRSLSVTTTVYFRKLKKEEIDHYAGTREPYDKAGAYAIQGLASLFIEKINGSHTNVVGFPIEVFLRELEALSGIALYRWFE